MFRDRLPRLLLPAILAVAFGARIGYALYVPDEFPYWRDGQHYLAIARSIATEGVYHDSVGEWPGEPWYSDTGPTSFWLPGYPFFLALLFRGLGESARVVFLAQALLGGATVWLCYRAAALLVGPRLALLAAALQAINPFSLFWVGTVAVEALATFLAIAALVAALRCDRALRERGSLPGADWILLVAVLALGILTRSFFVPVAGLTCGFLLWSLWRSGRSLRLVLRPALVGLAMSAALLAPWLVRNYLLWGTLVYDTKSGINLVIGNNDQATGRFGFAGVPDLSQLNELERDRLLRARARTWVLEHPGQALRLAGTKLLLFWNSVPARLEGKKLWACFAWSAGFLSLALLGVVYAAADPRRFALLYLALAGHLMTVALAFTTTRFRVPAEVLLAIFASAAFWRPALAEARARHPFSRLRPRNLAPQA